MGEAAGLRFYLALAEFAAQDIPGVEAKAGSWLGVHLCCSLSYFFFYSEPCLPHGLLLPSTWAEREESIGCKPQISLNPGLPSSIPSAPCGHCAGQEEPSLIPGWIREESSLFILCSTSAVLRYVLGLHGDVFALLSHPVARRGGVWM